MADKVITSTGDCSACCEPPADCSCALLIPIAGTPMGATVTPCADYATAAALVASIQVASCLGYCEYDGSSVFTSFTTDDSVADELTLEAVGNPQGSAQCQALMWCGLSALSGSTISVDSSAGGGLADGGSTLYSCDGALVSSESEATQTHSVPSDGTYYLLCDVTSNTSGASGGSDTLTAVVSCDMAIVFNPVIALWDDSGTTRKLWACPKLLLPPLTESTGTWYADCAAADAVLTDADQVSNCVGFCEGVPGLTAFTATDGGTSLTLAVTGVAGAAAWGGINAEDGETITVTGTVSTGTVSLTVDIYDDTGTLVESSGSSVSSPWTSAALPYTGRYSVRAVVQSTVGSDDTSGVITSSGTMSVNEIQALWDNGLTCPSRLDCGDSC